MSTSDRPAGRGRRMVAVACGLLLVAGVLILGLALVNQQGDPPQVPRTASTDAGDGNRADGLPAPPASGPSEGSDDTDTAGSSPSDSPTGDDPAAAEEPAGPPPLPASEPVSIEVPSIDVQSAVNPIGTNPDGTLAVPTGDEYDEAAWFTGSPTPGEVGPAVIEGHVTKLGSTPSVFFDLGAVKEGDRAQVERADGSVVTFEVYRVERYAKDDFPTAVVYGNTEVPELRLITCGGEYDPEGNRHLDNTVVYARMVSSGDGDRDVS